MPALILEQTSGANPISLRLEGSAAPEDSLVEGCELETVKHVYPGSREATIHVLAVKGTPVTLKGLFSDRESRVPGFADLMRSSLRAMALAATPVRMLYRDVVLEGVLEKVTFTDGRHQDEVGWELTFHPTAAAGVRRSLAAVDLLSALRARLLTSFTAWLDAWDEMPEEVRRPPTSSVLVEEDYLEPELIPPPEFILDPWLETRLIVEELHRRVRMILELLGIEALLNVDDQVTSMARTALVVANRVRYGIDEASEGGGPLGILEQMTRAENIYTATSAVDSMRLAL